MKLFSVIIVLMLTITACINKEAPSLSTQNSTQATLEIIIPDSLGKQVIITQTMDNFIDSQSDTLLVDDNYKVKWTTDLTRPQYVDVAIGPLNKSVFMNSGGNLLINIDSTKTFNYDGSLAKENNYIKAVNSNTLLKELGWNSTDRVSLDSFKVKLDKYFTAKKAILDENFPTAEEKSSGFYKLRLAEQRSLSNYGLINFLEFNYAGNKYDSLLAANLDQSFLDYEKVEPYYFDAYLFSTMYSNYMVQYFARKKYGESWKEERKKQGSYGLKMDIANEYYPAFIKNYVINESLSSLINYFADDYPDHLPAIPFLINKYGYQISEARVLEYGQMLNEKLQKSLAYEKGRQVPNFTLKDEQGETVKMIKEETKPMLLDIWASWCGPCIKNFDEVNKLEKQYQGKLVVKSISLDNVEADHTKALKTLEVPGVEHLWAPNAFNSDFAKFFQIASIPQYLLTDNKGKIVAFGLWNEVLEGIKELNL